MYQIQNTTREMSTRIQRYGQPTHNRLKQYVLKSQRRLVRGRPVLVTEEELQDNLEELREKSHDGILEVRTMDGRLVDLDTLNVAPVPPTMPSPSFPLDSVTRDKQNVGNYIPKFEGGRTPADLKKMHEAAAVDEAAVLEVPYVEASVTASVEVEDVVEASVEGEVPFTDKPSWGKKNKRR